MQTFFARLAAAGMAGLLTVLSLDGISVEDYGNDQIVIDDSIEIGDAVDDSAVVIVQDSDDNYAGEITEEIIQEDVEESAGDSGNVSLEEKYVDVDDPEESNEDTDEETKEEANECVKDDAKDDTYDLVKAEWNRDMAVICQKLDIGESEILALYDQAINENPYDASFYAGRAGFRKTTDENLQDIVDDYTMAIECTPDNLEYYCLRGWAYYEVGGDENNEKALADFNEVIKRDSRHNSSLAGIAYVYGNMKDYDQAISYIDRAISIKEYASYYEARGTMYLLKKDYDRAISDYEKSISLNGRDDLCRKKMLFAYYDRDNNYDKVREMIENEIAEHPNNPYLSSFYCIYGHTYYDEGEYDKALIKYRTANNVGKSKGVSNESLAFYLECCGDVYLALGDNEQAEKEYTNAQNLMDKANPDWGKYGYQKARAMFRQKKYDSALTSLKEITDNTQDSEVLQDCYVLTGHSYYSKAEYNEAIREYELSLQQTTDSCEKAYSFYWMAHAHHNKGEKSEAVDCARRAMSMDPTNEEYRKYFDEVNQA